MNSEFFEALQLLEKEKGISADYMLDKIKAALSVAIKHDFGGVDNALVDIDPVSSKYNVSIIKNVVEEVEDPKTEILLNEALKYNRRAQVGEPVEIPLETKQFGRIAAQNAKHVIRQGIREFEKEQLLQEFESREQEIVSAVVTKIDPMRGSATIEIGKNEALLPKSEMVPGEELREGDRIQVYIADVRSGEKGPMIKISRKHSGLVKRLFEKEVPEIYDGTVEVRSIAREAGSRTKIAVTSKDPNVDAVGACIGPKGSRVARIVEELGGEKIDVVRYNEDPAVFIKAALSPAEVVDVAILDETGRVCRVAVPDDQLSLAIGNRGQNARLAAHLTGWKIDIKSEREFIELRDQEAAMALAAEQEQDEQPLLEDELPDEETVILEDLEEI